MAHNQDGQLMHMVGEISSDVKHILLRQDKQDARLDRMSSRIHKIETFQWRILGIASIVPALIAAVAVYLTDRT